MALVMVLASIAILAVFVADMFESTSTSHAIAAQQRDRLQAEYMARSGLNLSRVLMSRQNANALTALVTPFYQQMLQSQPPSSLPLHLAAHEILLPFCNYDESTAVSQEAAFTLADAKGFGDNPGTCEIIAVSENSKINVSKPLSSAGDIARESVAEQMFGLMGGFQAESPYDPLFEQPDAHGNFHTRLDVVSALIDWWDEDTQRTVFDPGAREVTTAAGEDDIYSTLDDPYQVRNAAFDSLEELRLVRGIGDDFWATFIEPEPDDPRRRTVTIYGSGLVNVNEARARVLLTRACAILTSPQSLCEDVLEAAKFEELVNTLRAQFPLPVFANPHLFVEFLSGNGNIFQLLQGYLATAGLETLMFTPISPTPQEAQALNRWFVADARIVAFQIDGFAGRGRVQVSAIINNDDRWNPPPPNAGSMPELGVFHHYRID
ncbi:MAG: hypothetical protein AAGF12_18085 [Myxococcota bacterium]